MRLPERIRNKIYNVNHKHDLFLEGRLTRMVGLTLEAVGCVAPIGAHCSIVNENNQRFAAEVVGFSDNKTYLMPVDIPDEIIPGARVMPTDKMMQVPVGHELLGRVLDGACHPLDGKAIISPDTYYPLYAKRINPLKRTPIKEPLDVGVQSINALTTIGRGQRIGLFAGSGVGKSVLLGMMSRFTAADIVVVGLIGERGREVKEFIENNLGPQGLKRSVVVATPADNSPLMRLHGALVATTIAEYFRDQGANVLLLMDSLTRFAQAQREISLAIGEPPATKGYTPSVFAKLPSLVERAGTAEKGGGSITGFYTVLSEGDDLQDPIADSARAILDGHIVLSRKIAESGIYPAIDIEASLSRLMTTISSDEQVKAAQIFRHLLAKYQQNRDLITVGAYSQGSDRELDVAIQAMPQMIQFLQQNMNQQQTLEASRQGLLQLAQALNQALNHVQVNE